MNDAMRNKSLLVSPVFSEDGVINIPVRLKRKNEPARVVIDLYQEIDAHGEVVRLPVQLTVVSEISSKPLAICSLWNNSDYINALAHQKVRLLLSSPPKFLEKVDADFRDTFWLGQNNDLIDANRGAEQLLPTIRNTVQVNDPDTKLWFPHEIWETFLSVQGSYSGSQNKPRGTVVRWSWALGVLTTACGAVHDARIIDPNIILELKKTPIIADQNLEAFKEAFVDIEYIGTFIDCIYNSLINTDNFDNLGKLIDNDHEDFATHFNLNGWTSAAHLYLQRAFAIAKYMHWEHTNFGVQLHPQFKFLTKKFGSDIDCSAVWRHNTLYYHLSKTGVLDTHQVPYSPADHPPLWDVDEQFVNPNDSMVLTENLLQEAIALKSSYIPEGSFVEIDFPPFIGLKISEEDKLIQAMFVDEYDRFLMIYCSPYEETWEEMWTLPSFYSSIDGKDLITTNAIYALQQIIGAIIRDFWVIEEKEKMFGRPRLKKLLKSKTNIKRVVYLPRIRYIGLSGASERVKNLSYQSRQKHFVNGHRRKVQASALQTAKAKAAGIPLDEGETYVFPHYRGIDEKSNIVYRSKSY